MADSKKYDGSQWEHSLRKLATATEAVENPLYSDGTAITAYTLKGNEEHTGTPTPSAPISVNGVGNKTANLTTVYSPNTSSSGGLNFEAIGDKLRIYGTASTYVQCVNTNDIILPSGTYTFSISSSIGSTGFYAQFRSADGTTTYATIMNTTTITFNEATTGRIRVIISATEIKPYATDEVISIMINEGSTAKPYEPWGYKIPISNGQQTIDIYIGDLPLLKSLDGTAVDEISNGMLTRRVDSDGSVLPTPTTTQITMPSIPTTEGANSITVDTTVQPSEFTATWTGWHNASVKEWNGSQWNE